MARIVSDVTVEMPVVLSSKAASATLTSEFAFQESTEKPVFSTAFRAFVIRRQTGYFFRRELMYFGPEGPEVLCFCGAFSAVRGIDTSRLKRFHGRS